MKRLFLPIIIMIIFSFQPLLAEDTLPEGPGRKEVSAQCQACHGLGVLLQKRHSPEEWKAIVDKMIQFGLKVNEGEKKIIMDYLGTRLGSSH